jgi:hypothetical protein
MEAVVIARYLYCSFCDRQTHIGAKQVVLAGAVMIRLEGWGDISSICAAIIAAIGAISGTAASINSRRIRKKNRVALEDYLRAQKQYVSPGKKGQYTVAHLTAKLGMSEEQLIRASSDSRRIRRLTRKNDVTGDAEGLLFEYFYE